MSDHVFEMSGMDLVNNEIDYPELQARGKGKNWGFNNIFEFLLCDDWSIVTMSDMNSIIDKIEAAISLEWHMVRGLEYNT